MPSRIRTSSSATTTRPRFPATGSSIRPVVGAAQPSGGAGRTAGTGRSPKPPTAPSRRSAHPTLTAPAEDLRTIRGRAPSGSFRGAAHVIAVCGNPRWSLAGVVVYRPARRPHATRAGGAPQERRGAADGGYLQWPADAVLLASSRGLALLDRRRQSGLSPG